MLDSRKVACDDGSTGIEFQLECSSGDSKNRTETFWEDLSRLGEMNDEHLVTFYYDNQPLMKPGLQEVHKW